MKEPHDPNVPADSLADELKTAWKPSQRRP